MISAISIPSPLKTLRFPVAGLTLAPPQPGMGTNHQQQ
jgi:hypothetical protein